jgi:hypothetical protein
MPQVAQFSQRWSKSQFEYHEQSELPGTFEYETKLAILQPVVRATHASSEVMPSLAASHAPDGSALQSPPYEVEPHVPLPVVPTGGDGLGGGPSTRALVLRSYFLVLVLPWRQAEGTAPLSAPLSPHSRLDRAWSIAAGGHGGWFVPHALPGGKPGGVTLLDPAILHALLYPCARL